MEMGVLVLAYSCICLSSSFLWTAKGKGLGPVYDKVCLVRETTSECPYSSEFILEKKARSRDCVGASDAKNLVREGKTDLLKSFSISNMFAVVGNSLTSVVSNVYESAKDTGDKIYNTIRNTTLELMEGVRQVLKEEFRYYYLVDSAITFLSTDVATGSPLATATTYLWNIALVLLCLVLSFILLYFISWLFVLAFICIIILLHYWFESQDILYFLYLAFIYICQVTYFFAFEHPYLFCVIVFLLFVCWLLNVIYSWFIRPFLHYRERREERKRRRVMADSIIHLGEQLDEVSERLSRIELYHEEFKDTNRKIDAIMDYIEGRRVED